MKKLIVGDYDCSINTTVCVMEKHFHFVELTNKWTTLARELDAPAEKIFKWNKDLILERKNVSSVVADMLADWRLRLGNEARFEYFLDILGNKCGWKAVEDNLWQTFMKSMTDNISWDDLDMRSRKRVMESQVTFQGQIKRISDILSRFNETEVHGMMLSKLLGATILKLLRGEQVSLLSDDIPKTPSYYIPRIINSRRKIKVEIFQNNCPDVFVIEGITLSELSEIAGVEGIAKTSNQQEKLTSRFILLDVPDGFEVVTKISKNVPVHQLSLKNGDFLWMKSFNSLNLIQEYLHSDQDSISEDDFLFNLQEDHKAKLPVCIADIPGMGKTCLLANLAQQKRCNNNNEALVFFIALPKLLDSADCSSQVICKRSLCSIISNYVSKNELGQEIVSQTLYNDSAKVEIFFDAFDELPLYKQEVATKIIKCLLKQFKRVSITISTRVHKRQGLERALMVLSYNMQSFEHVGQLQFLERYWNKKCGVPIDDTLHHFSDFVASKVRAVLHSPESDVVGVPLQCSMLADIFKKDALRYSHATSIPFELSVNITSILDMYAALMTARFNEYVGEKQIFMKNLHILAAIGEVFPGTVSADNVWLNLENADLNEINCIGILFVEKKGNSVKHQFLHHSYAEYILAVYWAENLENQENWPVHVFEAVSIDNLLVEALRLSKYDADVRVNTTDCSAQNLLQVIYSSGEYKNICLNWEALAEKMHFSRIDITEIKSHVQSVDSVMSLVIIKWTQMFRTQPKLCHLLNALRSMDFRDTADNLEAEFGMPTFKQKSLCFFVDSTLQQKTELSNTKMPSTAYFNNLENLLSMLKACLYHNFSSLFTLISQHCLSMKHRKFRCVSKPSWNTLIVDAVKWSSLKLVSECCDFVELMEECKLCEMSCFITLDSFVYTPLHAAVARGDFTISDYLLKKFGSCVLAIKGLLHTCVELSLQNSDKTINEKIEIIQMIKNINENTVNEIEKGRSPILTHAVHVKLLQCMLTIGADINIVDTDDGNTVLHKAARYLPPSDFHLLTDFMLKMGHTEIFTVRNKLGDSPVNYAVNFIDVKLETINLLSLNSGDGCWNIADAQGRNALFHAVEGGRKKPVLEMIVECGGDPKRLTKYKGSILHVAAISGNFDAISYFVSLGYSVNALDVEGCTPLHLAFRFAHRNIEEAVDILLANKVNVNIRDHLGRKAIWYAKNEDKLWMLQPSTRDILVKTSKEVPIRTKLWRFITWSNSQN